MLCSTIIPTIGRPSLAAAISSVLAQGLNPADLEVIVVNDSGLPLPSALWQQSTQVRVIDTNRRNRSIARNVGAAAAKGDYLHFLDDDDWMVPRAYDALLRAAVESGAAWTHGGFRLTDNDGATVTEIHPSETGNCSIQMLAWEWLPLQASLIRAEAFFAVDGFASLPSLGGGFEDVHLSRQIAIVAGMARTPEVVATIRIGDVGSTTNYITMFDQNRRSREKTLDMPGAFERLVDSARSDPSTPRYWLGKVVYFYLASLKWNLQARRISTAIHRGTRAVAAVGRAGAHALSTEFWRGARRPHYPRMGTAIREAGADHLYAASRSAMGLVPGRPKG